MRYSEKVAPHLPRSDSPPPAVAPRVTALDSPRGAYGYLKLMHDLTAFTELPFYQRIGERTKVFVPFVRRAPIFFVPRPREGARASGAHTLGEPEHWDTPWDHISLMSTAPQMYGRQTARWTNARGEESWVKKVFTIEQVIERPSLTHERTPAQIEARWYRGLARVIDDGDYPRWTVSVQLVRVSDAERHGWSPFDAKRQWPFVGAPLHPLGILVLHRNAGRLPGRGKPHARRGRRSGAVTTDRLTVLR